MTTYSPPRAQPDQAQSGGIEAARRPLRLRIQSGRVSSRNHSLPRVRGRALTLTVMMPLFLLFLGATLVPSSLRPLDYLGIGYPRVLRYTHFIVRALALIAVLSFRRSPIAAFVI